jgi:hypothetical protein
MSFCKVKIVKKFKIKKNITFDIDPITSSELISTIKSGPDPIIESKSIVNSKTNVYVDLDKIPSDHYIGLILIKANGLVMSKKIKDSKKKIFLNITQIYSTSNSIPIHKLSNDLLDENFKYKKYIRTLLDNDYSIKNRHILGIKLFETYGNYHIYCIIINTNKSLTITGKLKSNYDWNRIFDFYYRDTNNLDPTQNDVYKSICTSGPISKIYNNKEKYLPDYIKNYTIYYKHILNVLQNFNFVV